jgi:hypothetical protein
MTMPDNGADMKDPIVIDPPGFDMAKRWAECNEASEHLSHEDGSVNWRAAFSADPGVCSCPACHEHFWAWGRVIRCTECGFEFPTDWWSMYAWGVQAGGNRKHRYRHAERMAHPYYRHGFEHPVDDAWEERERIDWRAVIDNPDNANPPEPK